MVFATLAIALVMIFGLTSYISKNNVSKDPDFSLQKQNTQMDENPDNPPRNIQVGYSEDNNFVADVARNASPGGSWDIGFKS